jgi:osmotically-inducible protein OsmY
MQANRKIRSLIFRLLQNNLALLVTFILVLMIPMAVGAADRPSDDTINYWIKDALREDQRVNVADITVKTNNGIVTLSGSTRNLAEKKYADLEAEKIQGVRGVINELVVKPAYRFDADIAQDIRQRLVYNAFIKSHGLWVTVFDGKAILNGKVNSWAERQEAELLATEVRGVKAVDNQLEVDYQTKRPDEQIKLDILTAIHRDVYLAGLPIQVLVYNGRVTLTGEVGNAYQKDRATDRSLGINNVKSVDNKIEITWWRERGVREKVASPSDDQLKQIVRDVLYQDKRVEPIDVTVDASYGHVTLRGAISSYHQKQLAEQDAREVVGVAWVSNLLSVRAEPRSDYSILHDIQLAIDSDYLLNGQDIKVRVQNGNVTLTGNVNEYYEKSDASAVTSKVLGVRDVANNITVNWFFKYTDAALEQRIKERLLSHDATRWVADQIKVVVKEGKATLIGEVYSWSERYEAGHIAFNTDGIKAVENDLSVIDVNYPWDKWNGPWF